ncbi:hypothetical protein [Listeria ilorinensis]|uniref:hypothetical protein n=1 Tax=Listeria ilorinensis TaxID=2867439 RepID=UPI001EF3F9CB|nr:hypothetical protein [Listeria ilorinensis]
MEQKALKPDDIRQLEEVFSSIGELIQDTPKKNPFEVLVQIEQQLEIYRLRQTETAQHFETRAAFQLECQHKSIHS